MEKNDAPDPPAEEEEEKEVKWFECHICKLREIYDVKTSKPNFTPFIRFSAETYVVKDPFTPPEKKQFLILGSDCCVCRNPVCQSNNCSIFHKQRYCQSCAADKKTIFPPQLHSKIKCLN